MDSVHEFPAGSVSTTGAGSSEPVTGGVKTQDLSVLENMMAGGQMLAAQSPSPSDWSPEKRLAGAVLASALVEIRDHHGDPHYCRKIAEDLEWIFSDEEEWPFSFLRLCGLFDLDPLWVRGIVNGWLNTPRHERERPASPYRQAA